MQHIAGWRRLCLAAGLALSLCRPLGATEPAAEPVDLELVLAIDCSSSVSSGEFALQLDGIAAAFRHPDVLAAIELAGSSGIAVTLLQWSSKANQVVAVDWSHVRDAETAALFAARVSAVPRAVGGGSTAIGSAILQGAILLDRNPYRGERRVIDVSGDGVGNQGPASAESRDLAAAIGITVNGLAITHKDGDLVEHYGRQVIGGPNAFLVTASDYRDFARAMLKKLVIEIGGPPVVRAPATDESPPAMPHLAANSCSNSEEASRSPMLAGLRLSRLDRLHFDRRGPGGPRVCFP